MEAEYRQLLVGLQVLEPWITTTGRPFIHCLSNHSFMHNIPVVKLQLSPPSVFSLNLLFWTDVVGGKIMQSQLNGSSIYTLVDVGLDTPGMLCAVDNFNGSSIYTLVNTGLHSMILLHG